MHMKREMGGAFRWRLTFSHYTNDSVAESGHWGVGRTLSGERPRLAAAAAAAVACLLIEITATQSGRRHRRSVSAARMDPCDALALLVTDHCLAH